jgi:hypothetical protein
MAPSTRKFGANFAEKRCSLGRYSSLADSGHGVFLVMKNGWSGMANAVKLLGLKVHTKNTSVCGTHSRLHAAETEYNRRIRGLYRRRCLKNEHRTVECYHWCDENFQEESYPSATWTATNPTWPGMKSLPPQCQDSNQPSEVTRSILIIGFCIYYSI